MFDWLKSWLFRNELEKIEEQEGEISANGGGDWEEVSNGVAHTFTNTGSDLKLQVTGTVASGETVAISGYRMGII